MTLFHARSNKRSLFSLMNKVLKILLIAIICFLFPILFFCIALYVTPEKSFLELDLITGNQLVRLLLTPMAIIVFAAALIIRERIITITAGIMIIYLLISNFKQIPLGKPDEAASGKETTISVLTFNGPGCVNETLDWLKDNPVDVVILQEIPGHTNLPYYREFEEIGYDFFADAVRSNFSVYMGIFVRGTIDSAALIDGDSYNKLLRYTLYAKAEVKGKRLNIYCVHLEPQHNKGEIKGIFKRNMLRYYQALNIANDIKKHPDQPVVLAGDFNSTPTNKCVKPLRSALKDTWIERGHGLGATWPSGNPWFRIDEILYSGFRGVDSVRVFRLADSDHLAYYAELVW